MQARNHFKLPQEAEERVRREQIAYLFRFPGRLLGNVVNAGLVVGVMWGDLSATLLLIWIGLVLAVTLARIRLSRAFRRADPGPADIERWAQRFMIRSCVTAAL
jgi:hypothetical protein